MDKGFYLYCIREKNDAKFSVKGINGEEILVIPYKDLEAVVSRISLDKFSSKDIQKKAQEDLKWIKEKVLAHERIIEKAMGSFSKNKGLKSVIPMKFGTVFKSKEKLENTLKKYYSKFKKTLKNLAGKQEWGVKIYLDQKAFEKEVKKISPVIQEKEKEIASLPEGMAYFLEKQIEEAISKEADKALGKYIEDFFESAKKYAEAGIKGKILERELTGKPLPMVLNAIFLISEKSLKDFIKEINNLDKEFKNKGFSFEYSGPWPPYNFV